MQNEIFSFRWVVFVGFFYGKKVKNICSTDDKGHKQNSKDENYKRQRNAVKHHWFDESNCSHSLCSIEWTAIMFKYRFRLLFSADWLSHALAIRIQYTLRRETLHWKCSLRLADGWLKIDFDQLALLPCGGYRMCRYSAQCHRNNSFDDAYVPIFYVFESSPRAKPNFN